MYQKDKNIKGGVCIKYMGVLKKSKKQGFIITFPGIWHVFIKM
jgi:hypothetical protein